jgi:hypothetical protein
LVVKTALVVAQSGWLHVLVGYTIFRSQWVALPGFAAIMILMGTRCGRCRTSFVDDRINQSVKVGRFWDTQIIDQCPVCQQGMFEKGRE